MRYILFQTKIPMYIVVYSVSLVNAEIVLDKMRNQEKAVQ